MEGTQLHRTRPATALKLARIARGYRLCDVRQVAGINESKLSAFENGEAEAPLNLILRLSHVYGYPPEVLRGKRDLVIYARATSF